MKLIFATHNENKVKEVNALLPPEIEVISLSSLNDTEEIAETGDTLLENALLKARHIYGKHSQNCFAEDTGLEVEALGGKPGVHTARYAGEDADSEANIELLLTNMQKEANRKARFRTVFALILNGKEYIFEGIAEGAITKSKSGVSGFGYDPIFKPEGYTFTFAEMSKEEKGRISHRGKALQKMLAFLHERN